MSELIQLMTVLAVPFSTLLYVRHLNRRDETADVATAPITTR